MKAGEDAGSQRILVLLTFTAVAARLLSLTFLHPLNWDEIEFFRATDWVRRGLVPFRDFWEHHTPLQWFVFAPFSALTDSPGAAAIIAMRWIQLPVWIAIFWLIHRWMRASGISRFARWMAIVIAVSSSLLMLPAVEYRVDVLASALYVGGLVLLQRNTPKANFFAGVLFCMTGFANIRLGPLLAITALLHQVVDARERRWGARRETSWVFAGVAAAFAGAILYFVSTRSLMSLYQHVWVENYLGDQYAEGMQWAFLHRFLIPLGVRIYGGSGAFDPIGIDAAGVAIYVLGFIGMARALREWKTPGPLSFLAVLQLSSLLFISVMKFVYNYHLIIVVLMMMPFVATGIEWLLGKSPGWKRAVVTAAVAFCVWSVALVLLRGKEGDLAYQNLVMREVHARTPPGSKVFDGVGWALRREPAYRHWFLPELVNLLVRHRHTPPFGVREWLHDPPAAVITDRNAIVWLRRENPELGAYVARHYLPVWRNLLLPGLSARLAARETANWIAPVAGRYRVTVDSELASHEWFSHPFGYRPGVDSRLELIGRNAGTLYWMKNGTRVSPAGDAIDLKTGDRLAVLSSQQTAVAVFLVPGDERTWFRQPPPGVTLDSEGVRVTHIPDFRLSLIHI